MQSVRDPGTDAWKLPEVVAVSTRVAPIGHVLTGTDPAGPTKSISVPFQLELTVASKRCAP